MRKERKLRRSLGRLHNGLTRKTWEGGQPLEFLCSHGTFSLLTGMFSRETSVSIPPIESDWHYGEPPPEPARSETLGTWRHVTVRVDPDLPSATVDVRTVGGGFRHVVLDLLEVHDGSSAACSRAPCPVRAVMEA